MTGIPSQSVSKRWQRCLACSLAVSVLSLAADGCGGGLKLLSATGVVKLDGKPVEGAAVTFTPVAGGPVASGTTGISGEYQLKTANEPGAMPGEYTVTITKQTMHNITPDGMPGPGGVRIEWHVPEKYSQADTSGLKATVGKEDEKLSFDLASQ